jgi:hypothetical protein
VEYVRVLFSDSEQRTVTIDDVDTGRVTGDVIDVEGGRHIISLKGPPDFQPPSHQVTIENTSELEPLEVEFTKRGVSGD